MQDHRWAESGQEAEPEQQAAAPWPRGPAVVAQVLQGPSATTPRAPTVPSPSGKEALLLEEVEAPGSC